MFDYVLDNFGKINIEDDRFMIEKSGKDYYDYPHWNKIRKQSLEYRV